MPWCNPGALEYLWFRLSTHLDYRRVEAVITQYHEELMAWVVNFVKDRPTSVLRAKGDPESLLELGTRQWTGYGAPQDKPAALEKWTTLVSSSEDVSLSLKALAYSSLAKGWLDRAEKGLKSAALNLYICLYDAGCSANEAVALGFTSRATLNVAERIESAGLRRSEDGKFPKVATERFERLTGLWRAFDVCSAEMAAEKSKREAKLSKVPLDYLCAAWDCGIAVTKKQTLQTCGGGCPPVLKPRYCSKECQRVDWKHHKPFCKPDATVSSVLVTNSTDAASAKRRRANLTGDAISEKSQPAGGRIIDVNLPGGGILHFSSEMPPQTMRKMKECLENGSGGVLFFGY